MISLPGEVLTSAKFVVDKSKQVSLNKEGLVDFAKTFHHGSTSHWLTAAPFDFSSLTDNQKLNFLLVFNSLSFSYWGEPKWTIDYNGQIYDGSWAMIVAIRKAMESGKPILDAGRRSAISKDEFAEIMRSTTEIPLLEERWRIAQETGRTLVERFDGQFANLVHKADGDAMKLLDLIVRTFPSFQDESEFEGHKIYFLKRAQLLVSDLYQLFGGEGYGNLRNVDQLTACADYKLPQMLRKLGIIRYSSKLSEAIDNKTEIIHGSPEEIEIRANTIWSVELIRQELERNGRVVMSIGINDHLWLMSQSKSPDDKPYHRTRTTAY